MHIRWEFIKLGADIAVERLSHAEHDFLDTQIHVFQGRMKADEEEFAKRFDMSRVDTDDCEAMLSTLHKSIRGTRTQIFFADVIRQALQMPLNPVRTYVLSDFM